MTSQYASTAERPMTSQYISTAEGFGIDRPSWILATSALHTATPTIGLLYNGPLYVAAYPVAVRLSPAVFSAVRFCTHRQQVPYDTGLGITEDLR